jgi:Na+-transporting NADH:ubiquinone oxidoreductase subunit NqrF
MWAARFWNKRYWTGRYWTPNQVPDTNVYVHVYPPINGRLFVPLSQKTFFIHNLPLMGKVIVNTPFKAFFKKEFINKGQVQSELNARTQVEGIKGYVGKIPTS